MTAVPAPSGGAPVPADLRKNLGRIVKDLGRDPANFGRNVDTLARDHVLTEAQADLFKGMIARADKQSDFQLRARAYAELGGEITENVAYFIGRTLTQPTADAEAVSSRRSAYVGAGSDWLVTNLPSL